MKTPIDCKVAEFVGRTQFHCVVPCLTTILSTRVLGNDFKSGKELSLCKKFLKLATNRCRSLIFTI